MRAQLQVSRLIFFFTAFFIFCDLAWSVPEFKKIWIQLGNKKLHVELADTPEKAAHGLMYRRTLNENEGMLFIFPQEQTLSFWMKNTFVDLSIGYFSNQGLLNEIFDMKAAKSEMQSHFETIQSTRPAQYALEMRLGWYRKNQIKVGDKLKIFIKK